MGKWHGTELPFSDPIVKVGSEYYFGDALMKVIDDPYAVESDVIYVIRPSLTGLPVEPEYLLLTDKELIYLTRWDDRYFLVKD